MEAQPTTNLDTTGKPPSFDPVLILTVLGLTALGVVMVYSASVVAAELKFHNGEHYLFRQLLHGLLGLGALAVGMRIPTHLYQRYAVWLLGAAIALLAVLLIPGIGITAGRSTRWIGLGALRFQPSEFAKAALVIFLAYSLVKKGERMKQLGVGFLSHLSVLSVLVLLCMKQPDFGTSVCMAVVMLGMMYVAGARLKYLLGVGALNILLVVWALHSSTRRMNRIDAWLDPFAHANSIGYHLVQSLRAIGSGGIFGLGLGESRQKLLFLPEAHTDFVMALVGEELGLVGIVLVVSAFGVLCWRGSKAAMDAATPFAGLLAFGITFSLVFQASINMAVVTGVLPTKGLTLPFVSYGGSSMLVSMWMAGILVRISSGIKDEARPAEERSPRSRPPASGRRKRAVRGAGLSDRILRGAS